MDIILLGGKAMNDTLGPGYKKVIVGPWLALLLSKRWDPSSSPISARWSRESIDSSFLLFGVNKKGSYSWSAYAFQLLIYLENGVGFHDANGQADVGFLGFPIL